MYKYPSVNGSSAVDDIYILQVSENLKPTVGQEFISIDEGLEFYIKYSKEAGFSVRSNSSNRCKAGGIENIGCTKKDIYNYEAKLHNEMWGKDAELLKKYFLTEQEKDPSFMFEIDADDECQLKRCFWSDLVCRRAYGCFGDVVVFDTTLISMKRMPANTPKMIITDQDPAMTKAVAQSLPNTFHRWVPAYVNHVFSAGMSSSQCVESSHAFFKRALAHQHHEDLNADHVDINEKPVLKQPLEMEKQMAEIYTRKIFYTFQDELWHSLVTVPQIVSENDTNKMYTVQNCPNGGVPRFQEIPYDKVLDYASCSCKKFKSEGIPCRHILAFLRLFELVDSIMSNEEAAVIVNDALQSLVDQFKSIGGSTKSGGISEKGGNVNDTTLKDPSQVRAKACGRRLKGEKEKATNAAKYRGRRCNGCGKIDQAHDKRSYPVLNKWSSQQENICQQESEFESDADQFYFYRASLEA
nr:protein FAR-RED IMPAIRED RESPONSE 1-like [Ziziphus jujuba var. spinosa]